jgi:non-ribosomal peptide synthase protein (TIGR01720 family)
LEGHGRENSIESIDVSRTIGWFTSMYPFNLQHNNDFVHLALITQNNLQQIIENGSGFGLLHYLSNESFNDFVKPQISFNYWGDFTIGDKVNSKNQENRQFKLSNFEHGNDCHEALDLYADIDVSGQKKDGCIQMTIQYSPLRIDPLKIQDLSQEFKRQIIALIIKIYHSIN